MLQSFLKSRRAMASIARDRRAELAAQAVLLHDIFGNAFRPLPPIDLAVLAWNDGCVGKLATGTYQERAFDRLLFLGDALEEASWIGAPMLATPAVTASLVESIVPS